MLLLPIILPFYLLGFIACLAIDILIFLYDALTFDFNSSDPLHFSMRYIECMK